MEKNRIYCENCLETMAKMSDCFIDLTVTSPPYDNLRNYKGYEFDWRKTLKELFRVTKNGSVVVWVVGDSTVKGSETGTSFRQALYAKEVGFNLHDTMIYQKQTPIPQFKSHRYTGSFEYMFIFSKGKPTRGKLIEIPCSSKGRVDRKYRGQVRANDEYVGKDKKVIKETKIKSNVWIFSQNNGIDRNIDHKAQFPEQLASDHIISWSNEDDLVYDPFMGSGTTAKMAIKNKRNFLGSEISLEYYQASNERIENFKRGLNESTGI